jgi:TfdA family taurine catabolism dioxygenase TauD
VGQSGRLSKGFAFLLLIIPLRPGEFEYAGYTYWSGGKLGKPSDNAAIERARPSVHSLMEKEYGKRSMDELFAHATRDEFVYRHEWKVGDVVMWDNRYILHLRDAVDEGPRLLKRTTIGLPSDRHVNPAGSLYHGPEVSVVG